MVFTNSKYTKYKYLLLNKGMRKALSFFLTAVSSAVVSILVIVLVFKPAQTKTGYVQLGKLYDEFELSKTLNAQFKQITSTKKNYIDSLEFQVKAIYTKVSTDKNNKALQEEFEMAQRHYLYQKEQFEQSAGAMEEDYNNKIWKQLNEYVSQFGKEKGYSYVFGADGSGTIMYGGEAEDITSAVLTFVNEKYQGK